jgi:hypothetical protein
MGCSLDTDGMEGGMMIRDENDALQALHLPLPLDPAPRKQSYEPPALVEWGSIIDLTQGLDANIEDDGFSGSGGV